MKPYEHQVEIAEKAYKVLKENLVVYLAMEERTGKTLTSILVCEKSKASNILIITKKKALDGWEDTINKFKPTKNYTYINYESLHKLVLTNYDLIIIDEAHSNLSAYPKVGTIWKKVYTLTRKKPIIYLSATPSAQTYAQLYHQLKLSSWTPWVKYKNFYDWHKVYGIPKIVYGAGGRQIIQYNEVKTDLVWKDVEHLFISYTRKELGFKHEPNDVIHYVELDSYTKRLYNELNKDSVIRELEYMADTPMKLLVGLFQLEGGTLKIDEDNSVDLLAASKINYIKKTWGDTKDLVIFYHFKYEELKLKKHFRNAKILQATSFAEGVDLSMYKTLVIYSMDFSTARYSQRRARQANMKREEEINVHYLLVKGGISEQVYRTVAVNKTNFIDKYFDKSLL
ncbi:MAG TPA: DEAD/DEAH box helicase family protein [Bacteroidales bacterium]|nr:DEAD/DEAH box helicase family protein [Bacteroidales bacterium]